MACWRAEAGGIVLAVRLTPKANRDAIDGIGVLADSSEVVLARVRAIPDSGEANAALTALVANALRRPKSAVTIVRGATQRLKQVRVAGDPAVLAAMVAEWPRKQPGIL